ncbi:MAG TPA: efflux RND transporter permease subunit [Planctomycetota bacterium]|jgi:cobalt-zinc-cadmium resistance protein CzcA|nr:efflux RND transporter permease subunit [Planctomycetota bacterium]
MIERLLRASFARPLVVLLLVALGTMFGAYGIAGLRRDVFPDLSAPVFNVIAQNPTMGPEELEVAISIPLENGLAGLPGIRRVRSVCQLGVAQVTVEFEPDADYYRSRQFVAERINQATSALPPGTEPPLLSSLTGRLNEIFEFTLEADPGATDLLTLRDLAEFEVRNRLLAVPGVAAVERLGGYLREFQVLLDPERMRARAVSVEEVLHAVREAGANAPGGFLTQGSVEVTVRTVARPSGTKDLRDVLVGRRGDVPVLLADVADVREGPAIRRGIAHRLQGEVVSCRVVKQFGADTVQVARGIRRALEDLRAVLPPGIRARVVYDQSDLIHEALWGVTRAILIGAVFVIAVILALLGDLRAALLIVVVLPVSLLIASLALARFDIGFNTMTLGGFAIAVGLLVDASIIMIENIVHRLSSATAANRREVALHAAREVGRPIAFAVSVLIAVFLPLLSLSGIEGRMYRPLAGAVVASLAVALLLALSAVPVAAAVFLGKSAASRGDTWLVRRVKALYVPVLDFSLRRAGVVQLGTLLVTVPVLALAFGIGIEFMPELDEGALLVQTLVPAEASLQEVDALNHRVEDEFRAFPEVEDVVRRTGRAERTEDPMPHTLSDVLVVFRKDRKRTAAELEKAMREKVENLPAVGTLFTTPLGMRIDEGLGGTPADIAVRIFGPDLDQLARSAEAAREIVAGVEGLADLRVEPLTGLPQVKIEIDRAAAARYGLTPGEISETARIALAGERVGEVWIPPRRYDVVVRLPEDRKTDPAALRQILLTGTGGLRVPLDQVARIEFGVGPSAVRRQAGMRRVALEASVVGGDLVGSARRVEERLRRELRLPSGYFFEVGGRVEQAGRASRSLTFALVAACAAVFLLLQLALGSLADTLVILGTLPTAIVGAVLALKVSGETWNVSSIVGVLGLLGIAVQNGLVLITQTRGLLAEGKPFREALREASVGRVRPKLMTAGVAILALLPLVVVRLPGTEIERPLAVVMIGGLVTSTLFTLLALPTFYSFVEGLRSRRRREAGTVVLAEATSPEGVAPARVDPESGGESRPSQACPVA